MNASNSSSDDDDDLSKRFAQEALEAHNKVRERHQVQPLVLSEKVYISRGTFHGST